MSKKVKPINEEVKISEYEVKLDQADSIITKTWNILKKHWGKLLIFLLIYGCYKFVVAVANTDVNKYPTEEVIQTEPVNDTKSSEVNQELEYPTTQLDEVYLVREYEEYQDDGSIEVMQVWSDSTKTVKQ